ncbi:MAG: hypothetical protein AAF938_21630 [Myxococcota bacterium]
MHHRPPDVYRMSLERLENTRPSVRTRLERVCEVVAIGAALLATLQVSVRAFAICALTLGTWVLGQRLGSYSWERVSTQPSKQKRVHLGWLSVGIDGISCELRRPTAPPLQHFFAFAKHPTVTVRDELMILRAGARSLTLQLPSASEAKAFQRAIRLHRAYFEHLGAEAPVVRFRADSPLPPIGGYRVAVRPTDSLEVCGRPHFDAVAFNDWSKLRPVERYSVANSCVHHSPRRTE